MQSGRTNRLDDRLPNPISRGSTINKGTTEKKREQVSERVRPGGSYVGHLPTRKIPVSNIPRGKPIKPAEDNRVSHSIRKLLSVYENGSNVKPKGNLKVNPTEKPVVGKRIPSAGKPSSRVMQKKQVRVNSPKPEPDGKDLLLTGSAFPVCDKRETVDVPTAVVQEGRMPEKSDLIVMLRRRNSEPDYPKSWSLLPRVENAPSLRCETVENYYFWETGLSHPYWEVSLFKSTKSLSVMNSGMLSLAPATDSAELLHLGRFNPRPKPLAEEKPSWLREMSSVSEEKMRTTMSFVTLVTEKDGLQSREIKSTESKPDPSPPLPRIFSKDDQYKPTGRLLVYVKSSQRKLVTVESRETNRSESSSPINKKIHKIAKISRINSTTRHVSSSSLSSWQQKVLAVTATTAFLIVLVGSGFLLFVYFLTRRNSFFNLTPPIPGLVRGF